MANGGRSCFLALFYTGYLWTCWFLEALAGANPMCRETGQAPSLREFMVRDRLAPFFDNCVLAAWRLCAWRGGGAVPRRDGAEPRPHTSGADPAGTRFRCGRMRLLLVPLTLPSGLLSARGGRARSPVPTLKRNMSPLIAIHTFHPLRGDGIP